MWGFRAKGPDYEHFVSANSQFNFNDFRGLRKNPVSSHGYRYRQRLCSSVRAIIAQEGRALVCQRCWNYCGAGQAGEPLKTKIVSHRDHWIKVKNPNARAFAREVGAYFAPSFISARAILPAMLASSQEKKRTGDSIRGSTADPSNISHVYRRGADQRCFTSIR